MPQKAKALLMVLVAIVSVQTGASLAKGLFPALGPSGISVLRLTMAALILAAVWLPWRAPLRGWRCT